MLVFERLKLRTLQLVNQKHAETMPRVYHIPCGVRGLQLPCTLLRVYIHASWVSLSLFIYKGFLRPQALNRQKTQILTFFVRAYIK